MSGYNPSPFSGGGSGSLTGQLRLVEDYGVSLTATAAANTTAINQALSDVTTPGSSKLGFGLYLRGNTAGMPYPVNTITLPSEPVRLWGDSPVLSVLGTTSGTLLTYNPAVAPLNTTTAPWANLNTSITSAIHYRSNSWDIANIGFTKTDNWSNNTGDGVVFANWTAGSQNQLVVHLTDVLITNFNGNGLNLAIVGLRPESRLSRVTTDGNAGVGMILPSDTLCDNIQSNNNANEGIQITGSNTIVSVFKCYANGAAHTAGRGSGVSVTNGNGGTTLIGGYCQDNDGPGVTIHNGQNVKLQVVADRNCWNNSVVNAALQSGVILNGGFGCDIDVIATDSWAGTKPNGQTHAILYQATDGTNTAFTTNQFNNIRLVQTQTLGATNTVGTAIDGNSVIDGAVITVNGAAQRRTKTVAAPGATPAMNTDMFDTYRFTGLAAAITSMTTSLTGTPAEGQVLRVSFTDNGTARAIAWGTSFEASTVALPTTTVISARLDVMFTWNSATSKWRCETVS